MAIFKMRNPTVYPIFSIPQWQGEDNVSEKTLIVHYEQGFGDTFLFSRYLPEVVKKFKKVYFVANFGTEMLIQNSFPDVEVVNCIPRGMGDYHVPIMSLPAMLNANPKKFRKKSWIKPDKKRVKEFKQYFSKDKFNIGIFWESTKTHLQRYTDLETLMPLAHIDNVQLYSLAINKEDFEVNYIDDSVNIINIGKHINNFSDTAAAIQNCDLIVATDSAIMNLAGAMGKKTFGLFTQIPEWRWFDLTGEDVVWYKSVKPFQAEHKNDFKPVIQRIIPEIEELIKNDKRFR